MNETTRPVLSASTALSTLGAGARRPDEEVIALCAEHTELERQKVVAWDTYSYPMNSEQEAALDKIHTGPLTDRQDKIIDRLCEIEATSVQGLLAKMACLAAFDPNVTDTSDCDGTVAGRMLPGIFRNAASLTRSVDCPAARIGHELIRASDRARAAENALCVAQGAKKPGEEIVELSFRDELLLGRRRALEVELSWQRATSLEGALHQVVIAINECMGLRDLSYSEEELEDHAERQRRLLYSIRHAIQDATGLDAEKVTASSHYMLPKFDPFAALADDSTSSIST